ncbi:MAG: HNH endonuclease signature motif containing protein [Clostridium sp.]
MAEEFAKKFYRSKAWLIFRQTILLDRTVDKDTGELKPIRCEHCGDKIIESKFIQLHHVIELTPDNINDVSITLNPDNIEVICQSCHNKVHGRFTNRARRKIKTKGIYIVYGAPMGGKHTYIKDNITPGDIVVDMDKLYEAVSLQPIYNKPDNLKYNVLSIRNLLIDNIKTRYGKFNTAWVVGGYPNKFDRERLANELGAELVYIDADKKDCYYRLEYCNDYRQDHKEEWKGYIDNWFDEFIL